jgi:hypothetical protein
MFAGNLGKLLGDQVIKKRVRNDPYVGRIAYRRKPLYGLLNHGTLTVQSQHLLCPRLPASWPESCSAPTRKNHRSEPLPRLTAFSRHTPPSYRQDATAPQSPIRLNPIYLNHSIPAHLPELCEVLPHALHTLVHHVMRHRVRQPYMLRRSECFARNNHNMRLAQKLGRKIGG